MLLKDVYGVAQDGLYEDFSELIDGPSKFVVLLISLDSPGDILSHCLIIQWRGDMKHPHLHPTRTLRCVMPSLLDTMMGLLGRNFFPLS